MYSSKLVKRKKHKKIALIITTLSSVIATALIIVSFLGNLVGSFTVKLYTSDVKLAMSASGDFANDTTTLIRVGDLPSFQLNENNQLLKHEEIDNPETSYLDNGSIGQDGEEPSTIYYFKQTFFVKNVGTVPASYDFSISITDNQRPNNVTYGYDDLLRVRLYTNDGNSSEHDYEVYAKYIRTGAAINYDDEGNPIYEEIVSYDPEDPDYMRRAVPFKNESTIMSDKVPSFSVGKVTRYTLLCWLDGEDSNANGPVPKGGSIKLEVNINAKETGK